MRFKKFIFALFALFILESGYGIDKWNIMFVNLRDLSQVKDKNTGLTIQKSIVAQLQKQNGFNLIQSRTNIVIDNYQAALNAGRAFKADVILYGDYYIEGEDLVIVVDIFDVLDNRLKMRKYYSGAVDLDIFDTIDSMSADMVQKIREALPELNAESEVRIKQVRQNVYETEKLNIKRMFYTRVGFYTEMGPKQFYKINGNSFGNGTSEYSFPDMVASQGLGSWFKFSSIPIGFALRVWDIRLDLLISGIPGVPQIAWQNGDYSYDTVPANLSFMQFSYYLPWFNNSLAVSVGAFSLQKFTFIGYDTSSKTFKYNENGGVSFDLSFGVIWNPNPDLELTLSFIPFLNASRNYPSGSSGQFYYYYFKRDFPSLTVGGIYFLGNFGIELKAFVDSYHYNEFILNPDGTTNYSQNSNGAIYENITAASVYAGFVYRIDFLK